MKETIRPVSRIVRGRPTSDGAGVNLTRVIGTRELLDLDPFLLLDEFKSENPHDYIGGFPPHPHRGFETITYLLHGNFKHHDSRGNEGHLTGGSVQWMTAGRGIIHSEMPEMTNGLVWGYQLWLNLPAADKMVEPRYQDIGPDQIPMVAHEGARVRIITGEYQGTSGPAQTRIPALYLDVELASHSTFQHTVPDSLATLAYVVDGQGAFGLDKQSDSMGASRLLVFGKGDTVQAMTGDQTVRFLLLAAEPLNEPIVRQGPFVMNTREELFRAFQDYQNGTLDQ
ncbi:pirin family protein [Candidatus Neomarinimicrobiota bacterium]